MILPFSTQLDGKPTYFVERIHKCFSLKEVYMVAGLDPSVHYPQDYNFIAKDKKPAKLHTIREDKKDRWKVGTKIDFFINCRQKNMFRFAPVLPVVSVQDISIEHDLFFGKHLGPQVVVNYKKLSPEQLKELAQNDGFDTVEAFFEYFNKDYKGKIIHWTDKLY
ncbi:hypothetical protein [Flavobacterium sp.]